MLGQSIEISFTGMQELQDDLMTAAKIAPEVLQKGLNKERLEFKHRMTVRAKDVFKTTENITSGFKMTTVNIEKNRLYSYFLPEGKGNKGAAWHLQEYGHRVVRPYFRSRRLRIKNSDGGSVLSVTKGKRIVDGVAPIFNAYFANKVEDMVAEILEKSNL